MNRYKTLIQVIDNFMMSKEYQNMIETYQDSEFLEVQSDFFNAIQKITNIAVENNECETRKIESTVISYIAVIEKLGIFIGFKFAFNLFNDLASKGGGNDV